MAAVYFLPTGAMADKGERKYAFSGEKLCWRDERPFVFPTRPKKFHYCFSCQGVGEECVSVSEGDWYDKRV